MKPSYIVGIVLLVIAAIMGVIFVSNSSEDNQASNRGDNSVQTNTDTSDSAQMASPDDGATLIETYPNLEGANIGNEVDAQDKDEVTISVDDFIFEETIVTISKGTTVTWVNNGKVGHDVAATDDSEIGDVNSELLASGESFSHTFEEVGQYDYFCSPHPAQMRGVIIVK